LKGLKSNRFCALIDVDFKGYTDAGPGVADAAGGSWYKEFLGEDGEEHTTPPGRAVFISNIGTLPSVDLADHGLFTAAILEGLKGAADTDGYEPDGVVTVDELSQYLDKRTHDLAREHGKTKEQKEQQFVALSSPGTHFALTVNPKAAAKSKAR